MSLTLNELKYQSIKRVWILHFLKLLPHLPGANELNPSIHRPSPNIAVYFLWCLLTGSSPHNHPIWYDPLSKETSGRTSWLAWRTQDDFYPENGDTHESTFFLFELFLIKPNNIFAFSIISHQWDGTVSWNFFWWRTRIGLYFTVYTMGADAIYAIYNEYSGLSTEGINLNKSYKIST